MTQTIHSTAIIAEKAKIGADVKIGPYCVIGEDAVIGDGGCAEFLVEDDVAAAWAERHLDCIGQLVDAGLQAAAGLFVK